MPFSFIVDNLSRVKRDAVPDSVSPGYGEIAMGSFSKIVHYMQHEGSITFNHLIQAPLPLRMDSTSSFLDIGSGFGKCVFHTKIQALVQRSVGIEYVATRSS